MQAIQRADSIAALRELAKRRIPRPIFDFIDGGADEEITLARNLSDFRRVELAPRVLRDVADTRTTEALVTRMAQDAGGLDAVVTAAGIDHPAPLNGLTGEDWEHIVRVNLFGTVATVRAALPFLVETHGRVVTIASSLALRALGDATAYCASKFGVLGFSRALAAETKGRIGVTTVFPAGMDTGFFAGRPEEYKPAADAQLIDPASVADAIVFALTRPVGVEMRELVMCPEEEPSWP